MKPSLKFCLWLSASTVRSLCILLTFVGIGCNSNRSDIVGTWVMQGPAEFKNPPAPGSPKWTLIFNKNGTFRSHLENHIMMHLVEDSSGTYVRNGTEVELKGTAKRFMDDGYKKGTSNEAVNYTFILIGSELKLKPEGGATTPVFRKR